MATNGIARNADVFHLLPGSPRVPSPGSCVCGALDHTAWEKTYVRPSVTLMYLPPTSKRLSAKHLRAAMDSVNSMSATAPSLRLTSSMRRLYMEPSQIEKMSRTPRSSIPSGRLKTVTHLLSFARSSTRSTWSAPSMAARRHTLPPLSGRVMLPIDKAPSRASPSTKRTRAHLTLSLSTNMSNCSTSSSHMSSPKQAAIPSSMTESSAAAGTSHTMRQRSAALASASMASSRLSS
mmetsp:Transcript_12742/g.37409  ORF Transcript_12742/g.37409 Transcript_12742/m.37409 type:complete len:235 (+) Transcript_12742:229-933(+)